VPNLLFNPKTDPNPKQNQKDEHIFYLKSLARKESKQTLNRTESHRANGQATRREEKIIAPRGDEMDGGKVGCCEGKMGAASYYRGLAKL
jgi:hypothetical protein